MAGVEGIALLRSFTEQGFERAFVDARLADIRRLIGDPVLAADGVTVRDIDTVEGYRVWSETYDAVPNTLFDYEQPWVEEVLRDLPLGVALDAACGTGRYAELLARQGHRVIGVDSSPDMLGRAACRVPGADFRLGRLQQLPLPDDAADVAVCALALEHVADLPPVFSELARVLRPGGHLVVSEKHETAVSQGGNPKVYDDAGRPCRLPAYRHGAGEYLRAALPVGLTVRGYEEPRPPVVDDGTSLEPVTELGPWHEWPWCLSGIVPEAATAAGACTPVTTVWHFQLERSPRGR